MKYFKALDEKRDWLSGYTAVKNELFTARERNSKVRYLYDDCFEVVDVPKSRTHKINGRRFILSPYPRKTGKSL